MSDTEDDALVWVAEATEALEALTNVLPLSALHDYAEENDFPQRILDGLDKMGEAVSFLISDGASVIEAFALTEAQRR